MQKQCITRHVRQQRMWKRQEIKLNKILIEKGFISILDTKKNCNKIQTNLIIFYAFFLVCLLQNGSNMEREWNRMTLNNCFISWWKEKTYPSKNLLNWIIFLASSAYSPFYPTHIDKNILFDYPSFCWKILFEKCLNKNWISLFLKDFSSTSFHLFYWFFFLPNPVSIQFWCSFGQTKAKKIV